MDLTTFNETGWIQTRSHRHDGQLRHHRRLCREVTVISDPAVRAVVTGTVMLTAGVQLEIVVVQGQSTPTAAAAAVAASCTSSAQVTACRRRGRRRRRLDFQESRSPPRPTRPAPASRCAWTMARAGPAALAAAGGILSMAITMAAAAAAGPVMAAPAAAIFRDWADREQPASRGSGILDDNGGFGGGGGGVSIRAVAAALSGGGGGDGLLILSTGGVAACTWGGSVTPRRSRRPARWLREHLPSARHHPFPPSLHLFASGHGRPRADGIIAR